ncbi:phage baseplate assembly protein V [Cupriavidus basilensis]|uniref:Phage baseplate assembly protein V n=1 Tax=Cupriavidus basilensis TaxID=68895 RepID=A0A643G589_9BURK|nr:phage baseplate assembly protein V [Cupriavidus basilensis]QOT75050.1 phage baseplate assembly protein V [Cupriavidus basilensis]
MRQALEALGARVRMLVGRGRITTGNDAGGVQQQQVQLADVETGDNRPRVAEFGFTSMPPTGSDAVVVFLSGDRSAGVIIGTNHQASRPRNLKPGETMVFSLDGKCVYLSDAGIVVEAKGQDVTVREAATVTVEASTEIIAKTPLLKCSGDIQDNYETNPHTMAQMRAIYNTHDHNIEEVQTGTSTITSKHPNQTE